MKKQLLFSALLFVCSFQSFSQDTLASMLEVGNKWGKYTYSQRLAPPHFVGDSIKKDTVISGKKYYQVERKYFEYLRPNEVTTSRFFIRQEKNTLYSIDLQKDSSFILYRFTGLHVGDSLITTNDIYLGDYEIRKVDTLKFDNFKIRQFGLKTSDNNGNSVYDSLVYFFEMIGSEGSGLDFSRAYFFESQHRLLCSQNKYGNFELDLYAKNIYNRLKYNSGGSQSNCKILILDIKDNSLSSQITFSQPTENQLQLNTELNLNNAQITIFDMKGIEYRSSLHDQNKIDISTLTNGLYILKLQTADNKLASFKFIK